MCSKARGEASVFGFPDAKNEKQTAMPSADRVQVRSSGVLIHTCGKNIEAQSHHPTHDSVN